MAEKPPSLDELIARTKGASMAELPRLVNGRALLYARREVLARKFATLMVENGMREDKAYYSMEVAFHGARRKPSNGKIYRRPRELLMMRRWTLLSLPYVKEILEGSKDRAAAVMDAAFQYLQTVLLTNPTTFVQIIENDDGTVRYRFNPFQQHITDAQRSVITRMKIDNEYGGIDELTTPDPTKAIDQLIKLVSLKENAKAVGSMDGKAKEIAERFQKARLARVDSMQKPVLIVAQEGIARAARR